MGARCVVFPTQTGLCHTCPQPGSRLETPVARTTPCLRPLQGLTDVGDSDIPFSTEPGATEQHGKFKSELRYWPVRISKQWTMS